MVYILKVMDETLVFEGKAFISSKRAARITNYTADYVGQLCRSGKINAKLLGRNWYIEEVSIRNHKLISPSTKRSIVSKKKTNKIQVSVKKEAKTSKANKILVTMVKQTASAVDKEAIVVDCVNTSNKQHRLATLKIAIFIVIVLMVLLSLFLFQKELTYTRQY